MALTPTDWALNYTAKTITHVAGTTVNTVNELYSWLMDLFDDAGQMDDEVPMSAQTPTAYTLINGWTIPDASYQFLNGGAVTDVANSALWANIYTLGTIVSGAQVYIIQNGAEITPYWGTDHIDVLVKVKAAGALIDSGLLTIMTRDWGNTYDHFAVNCSGGGRSAVPLANATDLNNQTLKATVAAYIGITATFGTVSKNLNNGNGATNYDVVVDCGTQSLSKVYEYLKYLTEHDAPGLVNGVDGEQYLGANASYAPVKVAPFGSFAGGTFFGARGVWLENMDAADAKAFQLINAAGVTQSPPNTVAVKVTGVQIGDRVGVFVLTTEGGAINKSQYTAAAGNNSGNGTLVVQQAIASDTPSAGVVRINDTPYVYTSWATSTFTLSGTLAANYALNDGVYVPLVDEVATATTAQNTLIYSANKPVLVRVRKKGILPFEVESTVTTTGMSVAAIRTIDGIVS